MKDRLEQLIIFFKSTLYEMEVKLPGQMIKLKPLFLQTSYCITYSTFSTNPRKC